MKVKRAEIDAEILAGLAQYNATKFIEDTSFLEMLEDLYSSASADIINLQLELDSIQWGALTESQKRKFLIDTLDGSMFQQAVAGSVQKEQVSRVHSVEQNNPVNCFVIDTAWRRKSERLAD